MAEPLRLTGAACRAARGLLNWSQADLQRHASVSPNTLADLETNRRELRPETAAKIVAVFEVHGVELFNGDRPGARMKAKARR